MCIVWVTNPIEVICEPVAEPSREQEREIVDDAPTFPIPDRCVFERMEVAHDVMSANILLSRRRGKGMVGIWAAMGARTGRQAAGTGQNKWKKTLTMSLEQ
jgi:hypothetical protein